MSFHENPNKGHTNLFIDLNGVPYLLAEYLDKRALQTLDRSQVRSDIFIDLTESMRAIIDINIDDIGVRAGDNLLNVVGNNTKQVNLLKMINAHKENFHHQLPVFARGIVVRINYQLESHKTGQVIRSMSEDLRIVDRNYFLDINRRNVNDNAIVVNMSNTLVSTVNEFTHGREKMMLRITNIQLFYECLGDSYKMPKMHQSLVHPDYPAMVPGMSPADYYNYHREMQSHHHIGLDDYGHEHPSMISPPSWTHFNRYYHFDSNGKDIVFHEQEVFDMSCQRKLIPCGSVVVNRKFIINPGHRLIFKISIWKNDLTIVNDCTRIAELLDAPVYDYHMPHHDHHDDHHKHDHHHPDFKEPPTNPEYEEIMRNMSEQLNAQMAENNRQSHMIEDMMKEIRRLNDVVNNLQGGNSGEESDDTEDGDNCCCNNMEEISPEEVRSMFSKPPVDVVSPEGDISEID